MSVGVIGAGAFGTSLALTLARAGTEVVLWARDPDRAEAMQVQRENAARLPGHRFPEGLRATADHAEASAPGTLLLAVPMQALGGHLRDYAGVYAGKRLVACCKGIDLASGLGPAALIADALPDAMPAMLSGPSFATDLAAGLPTAVTLAASHEDIAADLQAELSTTALRLYRATDLAGVELGGALKNVIALACGFVMGAGLGDSARAALLTRGFAEMQRFALAAGARAETLAGLSGLGDLVLTCTSEKSRNFCHGILVGRDGPQPSGETTEGIATAAAVARLAAKRGADMPVTAMVDAVLAGRITLDEAAATLLARPLRSE